jgi:hypothetical protein
MKDMVRMMSDIVRWNDEAIKNWTVLDLERTECLFAQTLTLLHTLCQNLAPPPLPPGQQSDSTSSSPPPTSINRAPTTRTKSFIIIDNSFHNNFTAKSNVPIPNLQPTESSAGTRPYAKAFLLSPLINGVDHDREESATIHLIAAIVFYNTGLFYHLGGASRRYGRCMMDHHFCHHQLVRRYYRQADALLGRFMDTTRQGRRLLWTVQAAIWHNLSMNSAVVVGTKKNTNAAAAYHREIVWVNMSQLDAYVGWVEDAEDRTFFLQSIQMANNNNAAAAALQQQNSSCRC